MKRILLLFFFIFSSLFLFLFSVQHVHAQVLPDTFTYNGVVKNGNGEPVQALQVTLTNGTYSDQDYSAADGSFALHIPSGTYKLIISYFGSDAKIPGIQQFFIPNISVSADTTQDITIPTKDLQVRVVDESNTPIQGATITVFSNFSGILPFALWSGGPNVTINSAEQTNPIASDLDGNANVPLLPTSLAVVTVTPPDGSNYASQTQTVSFTSAGSTTVTLLTVHSYNGFLRNGNGDPIAGASVGLTNSSTIADFVTTASDGFFSIHVPSGTYKLRLSYQGSDTVLPNIQQYEIPNIAISSDVTQDLTIPTQNLTVAVLDESNTPIQDAVVNVFSSFSNISSFSLWSGGPAVIINSAEQTNPFTTNSNGQVVIPFLPTASAVITVNPQSGSSLSSQTKTIAFTSTATTTVTLPTTRTYSGILRNGNGDPISGASVGLDNGSNIHSFVTTASDGSFVMHVPTGTYKLVLSSPSAGQTNVPIFQNYFISGIDVHADINQDFTIPTHNLEVTVIKSSGAPVQNANVTVFSSLNNISPFNLWPGGSNITNNGSEQSNPLFTDTNGRVVIPFLFTSAAVITIVPANADNLPTLTVTVPFTNDNPITISYDKAPQLAQLSGTTIAAGGTYTENGLFTDPDSTAWSATVDYGDGSGKQSLLLSGTTFSLSHHYVTAGIYSVTVEVTDDQGKRGTSNAQVTVTAAPTPTSSVPTTITFSASSDAYIRSGQPDRNQGGDSFMRIQSSGSNRGLVRFNQGDITSAIGNHTIISAKLRLTIANNGNNWGTGRTVDVHRLITNWVEGNGTEDARGTGNGTTWNCAVDSLIQNQIKNCIGSTEWEMGQSNNTTVHPWINTPTASQTITNGLLGIVEYDVKSDVLDFLNGTSNYGWIIKKTNEGQSGQIDFTTKEGGSAPQLIITYQP